MTKLNEESKYYNKLARASNRRRQFAGQFEPVRDVIPGIVYSINESIYVPTRGVNYVYVHEFGINSSNAYAYKPPDVIVWEGAGVLMMRSPRPPYELEIIATHVSPYPRTVVSSTQIIRTAVSIHGANHQWPTEATKGNDPVAIWPAAIQMLKSVADESNLEVTVGPLAYEYGGRQWFPTETVDLTAYIPATDMVVCALLSLDMPSGTVTVTLGATVDDPYGTMIPPKPDTPANGIASGYFYLRGGATTLSMVNDYLDARLWFSPGAGSVSMGQLGHLENQFDFIISDHIINHPAASVNAAYGEMYLTSTATTTIAARSSKSAVIDGANYVKAAGTTTAGDLNDFSMPSNNRLRYDGSATKKFLVNVSITITSANDAEDAALKIAKGGTVIDGTFSSTYMNYLGTYYPASTTGIVLSMAQNDYLELFIANETSSADLDLESMVFTMVEIP